MTKQEFHYQMMLMVMTLRERCRQSSVLGQNWQCFLAMSSHIAFFCSIFSQSTLSQETVELRLWLNPDPLRDVFVHKKDIL
ncbi:hypothetical protein NQZ68_029322 [Dissostichus eleginoides]|nr:hypothetical protein NQZ68_029322 [Dissostichus eleginoides]